MKFVLEVEIDGFGENTQQELGRILRYWGGNLKYFKLVPGDEAAITDSAYREVGRWRIVADAE